MGIARYNWKITDPQQVVHIENAEVEYNHRLLIERIIKSTDGDVPLDLSPIHTTTNLIPENATFGAAFSDNINANWGDGNLVGTAFNGANVLNGALNLVYNDVRYVDFLAADNASSEQTGAIRFILTPNYSGTPSESQVFVLICEADSVTHNEINIFHQTGTGDLKVTIRNNSGVIITSTTYNNWSPVALTSYQIEVNYDLSLGKTRLFLNGAVVASDLVSTGIRDAHVHLLRIGSNSLHVTPANFRISNLIIFNDVIHTEDYTPDNGLIPVNPTEETNYLKLITIQTNTPIIANLGDCEFIIDSFYFLSPGTNIISIRNENSLIPAIVTIRAYGEIPE